MPTISMFYGIIVTICYEDTGRHHTPHIHVRYQGKKASLAIEDGAVLAGDFPAKQLRMVQVWMDLPTMNYWRIGKWHWPVKNHFVFNRYNKPGGSDGNVIGCHQR